MLAPSVRRSTVVFCLAILTGGSGLCLSAEAGGTPWRAGWCSLRKPGELVACAKEVGFNALIAHGSKERMRAFAKRAKDAGIESYYWISLIPKGKDMARFAQVMGPEDDRALDEITADKDPAKHGYQFGGEPLPNRHDVLTTPVLCFHHPEVFAYCKRTIREMMEACPDLTGVAFDYFGYRNYRCCLCPYSRELFAAWRKQHPELSGQKALEQFSRDTLVDFNNRLAAFVRRIRPGAKVATHVYPVFLPEPLYGNRLDVDYCCQTVAWFFKPYWSTEKTARYARSVVREQGRFHSRARGVPFIGVYAGRSYADKSPERLERELRIVKQTVGLDALSFYSFNEFVKHPELRNVLKRMLALPAAIP